MELTLPNLREGYVELLRHLLMEGRPVRARGLVTTELTAVTLIFDDPLAPLLPVGVGRRVNQRLAAVEALQVVAGVSRPDLLRLAAPSYADVLVDPDDLDYGAYGPRLAGQLVDCLELLRDDPSTRRAVAAIWREEDLTHAGDRPCTIFMQFLVRPSLLDAAVNLEVEEPSLELHVHMRSQDVWLGVPYDVFTFSQVQHTLARELRLPAGRYVHHVTSLHLYETNEEVAEAVVAAYDELPELSSCDDLPLGVVAVDLATSGLDVAGYLLNDSLRGSRVGSSYPEQAANEWYVRRLNELHDAR